MGLETFDSTLVKLFPMSDCLPIGRLYLGTLLVGLLIMKSVQFFPVWYVWLGDVLSTCRSHLCMACRLFGHFLMKVHHVSSEIPLADRQDA